MMANSWIACSLQVSDVSRSMSAPTPRGAQHEAGLWGSLPGSLPLKQLSHQLSSKRAKSAQRFPMPESSAEGSAENFGPGNDSLLSG